MGEESGNENFMLEFLGQSSIHGDEDNFLEMDSHYFTHVIPQEDDSFSEIWVKDDVLVYTILQLP